MAETRELDFDALIRAEQRWIVRQQVARYARAIAERDEVAQGELLAMLLGDSDEG